MGLPPVLRRRPPVSADPSSDDPQYSLAVRAAGVSTSQLPSPSHQVVNAATRSDGELSLIY